MKSIQRFAVVVALSFAAPFLGHAQEADLQKAYAQMDASAAKFQDVQADITVDNYTAVVQDHEIQKGTTTFRRVGASTEMVTLLDKGQPSEKELLYKNGELDVYSPAQKQEQIFTAGANKAEYDSLLATGFGATGKELTAQWEVTVQGMETFDGVETAKLDLVSKHENVRSNFSHMTIWVDLGRDITLKQIMFQPDGDTHTNTWSNIRYNKHVSGSLFALHVATGTQVQRR